MLALIGFFALALKLVLAPLFLMVFVFWLWMLIHAVTNNALGTGEKIAWVLVVLFLHFLGALIYFFVGRRHVT